MTTTIKAAELVAGDVIITHPDHPNLTVKRVTHGRNGGIWIKYDGRDQLDQLDPSEEREVQRGEDSDAKPTKPRRVTEDDQYVAMLQRMIRGLERRAIDNPAILAQVLLLAQQLSEVTNVVIATSAARFSNDPFSAPSAGELARMLKMSKQSASERRKTGDRILFERAMGVETMPQRERAARTKATNYAEEKLASWLERRTTV